MQMLHAVMPASYKVMSSYKIPPGSRGPRSDLLSGELPREVPPKPSLDKLQTPASLLISPRSIDELKHLPPCIRPPAHAPDPAIIGLGIPG